MGELAKGTGPKWRQKIRNAIRKLHGPYSAGAVESALSGTLLDAWKACSPTRFGKPFEQLTDEEVGQLAHALAGFVVVFLLEEGKRGSL